MISLARLSAPRVHQGRRGLGVVGMTVAAQQYSGVFEGNAWPVPPRGVLNSGGRI